MQRKYGNVDDWGQADDQGGQRAGVLPESTPLQDACEDTAELTRVVGLADVGQASRGKNLYTACVISYDIVGCSMSVATPQPA